MQALQQVGATLHWGAWASHCCGFEPACLALKGGFLTTGPPGEPLKIVLILQNPCNVLRDSLLPPLCPECFVDKL